VSSEQTNSPLPLGEGLGERAYGAVTPSPSPSQGEGNDESGPAPITRDAIVAAARSFLGVPFRHQGVDPETGLDCRGLLIAVARKLGHEPRHEHRMNYKRHPDPAEFRAALESELEEIAVSDADDGDVVLVRALKQKPEEATHAGILASGRYERMIIHATDSDRQVLEEPYRPGHVRLAVAAFRFPGVTVDGRRSTVA